VLPKKRKGTAEDPYKNYNEPLVVANGRALLTEVPSKRDKVIVKGSGIAWKEVREGTPLQSDYFIVDYPNGVVNFNGDHEGKSLTFQYIGTGVYYSPASRIWTKQSGGVVTETLDEFVDKADGRIEQVDEAIYNAEQTTYKTEQERLRTEKETQRSIQARSDYETVVENTEKIYKPNVKTYEELLVTYPNPENGTTVTVEQRYEADGVWKSVTYRWNKFEWVDIGIGEDFDGFNVVMSSTPPANINNLWLETPSLPRAMRTKVSKEQPLNHQLWIQIIEG
jgi:hypothetical protein